MRLWLYILCWLCIVIIIAQFVSGQEFGAYYLLPLVFVAVSLWFLLRAWQKKEKKKEGAF